MEHGALRSVASLLLFLVVGLAPGKADRDDASMFEASSRHGRTQLAVHDTGAIRMASRKAAMKATVEVEALSESEVQARLELDQAALAQAIDRLQDALLETHGHIVEKKKKRRIKADVEAASPHHAHGEKVSAHFAKSKEATELEQLRAENEALRKQATGQQINDRAADLEDQIAKMDLWEEASEMPNLDSCKIKKEDDPMKTVSNLASCTKELETAAKLTMESKDQSQEANDKYVQKFREVMMIMDELRNLKELWEAFRADHNAAKTTLVEKAKELEPVIKALGGGEAAKQYKAAANKDD